MKHRFWLGMMAGLLLTVCHSAEAGTQKQIKIHFIDVGYADAILIETPAGRNVLIDAGSAAQAHHLLDYLKRHSIKNLEYLILTHPHENHFGGIIPVWDAVTVSDFYSNNGQNSGEEYQAFKKDLGRRNIAPKILSAGDVLPSVYEGLTLKVLSPKTVAGSINGSSLVIRVTFKKADVLLTADIEPEQQERLLKEYPDLNHVQAVQVPHHGDQMATSFKEYFSRQFWIASTGPNPYGMPFEPGLLSLGDNLWRTDQHGTIVLILDGKGVRIESQHKN